MSGNESEEPRIKLELSNESKELLERLRTQQKIEMFARSASERGVLAQARPQSEADATSLVTALLAMNVESERQLYIARRERDTCSDEVDHLKRQVDACHTKIERLETEVSTRKNDAEKLQLELEKVTETANRTVCVRDMFVRVLPHQERNDRPTVPSEAAIRLQTRIDAEEFVEKIEALYDDRALVDVLRTVLGRIAISSQIRKDLHDRLPEFADALADNAVTNEGFAVLFGIDLEPVFREVHASNMRKGDGPIVDGKRRKPEGWVGPDVVGVLRNQGWQSSSELKVDEPIPYALGPNAEQSVCDIHGEPEDAHPCIRCENAQYNGSEIDPKSLPKVPQRNVVSIDRTLWESDKCPTWNAVLVHIEGIPLVVCRAEFNGAKNRRRFSMHFFGNDTTLAPYKAFFEEERGLWIDNEYMGKIRIVGIGEGLVHNDKQTYNIRIDVARA